MHTDSDVPESGAAFTFGRSKFNDNVPGKFWIRDDPILQVACGDEHTALLTASGRVFTFGSNEWGQLGHGHTKTLTKPTCVKGLKPHRATIIACGRSHTLVATDSGYVYGFGANSEGQLGSSLKYNIHMTPVRIQGFDDVTIKMLSGGAEHSIALTDKGAVYVWGTGTEGQLGLEKSQYIYPTELKFDSDVMCISAGYYHSAFVTVDGKLYTCGENESGKLGISNMDMKNALQPHLVTGIPGRIIYVSCGGGHTIVLTANGKAYGFGNGFNGQLGIGDRILETYSPRLVIFPDDVKVARVSCGENHTAFLTDTGRLFTCGDGRHGKVGVFEDIDENITNLFYPTLLKCFTNFQVQQVSSGGCHMLVLAIKQKIFQRTESMDSCPTRKRDILNNNKTPPNQKAERKKSIGSMQSISRHSRSVSVSKSPIWYVPLERNDDASDEPELNSDDEVLSRLEQRCSLLSSLEGSIRHVDSDVESEDSDFSEKKTYIEIKDSQNNNSHIEDFVSPVDINVELNTINDQNTSNNLNGDASSESNLPKSKENDLALSKNKEVRKSTFYDIDDTIEKRSVTSLDSQSMKACVLL